MKKLMLFNHYKHNGTFTTYDKFVIANLEVAKGGDKND